MSSVDDYQDWNQAHSGAWRQLPPTSEDTEGRQGNLVSTEYDAELLVGLVTQPRIWSALYCHPDFSICRFFIGSFLCNFETFSSEQLKIWLLWPWQSLWWLLAAVLQCGLLCLWSTSGLGSGSLKVPMWLLCLSSLLEPKTQLRKKSRIPNHLPSSSEDRNKAVTWLWKRNVEVRKGKGNAGFLHPVRDRAWNQRLKRTKSNNFLSKMTAKWDVLTWKRMSQVREVEG